MHVFDGRWDLCESGYIQTNVIKDPFMGEHP